MEINSFFKVLLSLILIWLFGLFVKLYNTLIAKPLKLRLALQKQGIRGPPGTLLLGNLLEIHNAFSNASIASGTSNDFPVSHNIQSILFPFVDRWLEKYGNYMHVCSRIIIISPSFLSFFLSKITASSSETLLYLELIGEIFMISIGSTQILGVAKPEMVREIMNTSTNFDKPPYHMELLKPLFGDGVITSSGAKWNSQRKILAPEFHLEKLKV